MNLVGARKGLTLALISLLALAGCGDTINDPDDIAPAPEPAPEPPPVEPNLASVSVDLIGGLVTAEGSADGMGQFTAEVNLDDGDISGSVTFSSFTPDSVSLNEGFVGEDGETIALLEADGDAFVIPDGTVLSAEQLTLLADAGLNILASNATESIRAQLLIGDDQEIVLVFLSGEQQIPAVSDPSTVSVATPIATTGTAGFTLNRETGEVFIRLLTDSPIDSAALNVGLAGIDNDEIALELQADAVADGLFVEPVGGATLSSDQIDLFDNAELFFEVFTPDNPDGDARGQLLPEGVDLTFTLLSPAAVVDVSGPVTSDASGVAATTVYDETPVRLSINVNLTNLEDSTGVTLNEGAVGENGDVVFSLVQDLNNLSLWSLIDQELDVVQDNLLNTQQLFVTAASADFPGGEIRGQIVPEDSAPPPPPGILTVLDVDPAAGAVLPEFPESVVVTLSEELDPLTVTDQSVALVASGGDGIFDNGDDVLIGATAIVAEGNVITLDLSGVVADDDVFQLQLSGTEPDAIVSAEGSILDGDADGEPGGDFTSNFMVVGPQPLMVEAVDPVDGASVDVSPEQVVATLDRAALASSVNAATVLLVGSGGDGTFTDGNEVSITAAAISVNGADIEFDLTGIVLDPDSYQFTLVGTGTSPIVAADDGGILDGDGDDVAGGDFVSLFTVNEAAVVAPTFTQIQETIFTPICTECHNIGNQPAGLGLDAAISFVEIVGQQSTQQPDAGVTLNRITPNDPANSYLVRKLQGPAAANILGSQMPLGGPPLDPALLQDLIDWVNSGAPNN